MAESGCRRAAASCGYMGDELSFGVNLAGCAVIVAELSYSNQEVVLLQICCTAESLPRDIHHTKLAL